MKMPQDVEKQIDECIDRKLPVFLSSKGVNIAFQTRIIKRLEHQIIVENRVPPEHIQDFKKSDSFSLQFKMMRLQSTELAPHGCDMNFTFQSNSLIDETRQAARFIFSPDEQVVAEILNPFDKTTVLKKNVIDMSATGMSLQMNELTEVFRSGMHLNDIILMINKKPYQRAGAEVVYGRRFRDLNGKIRVQVGLKFTGN